VARIHFGSLVQLTSLCFRWPFGLPQTRSRPEKQPQIFDAVSFPFPASASPITGPGTKQSASSLFWPRLAKPAENPLSSRFKANVVPFDESNAFIALPLDLFIFESPAFDTQLF
jgi:hypothetical protein